MPAVIDSFQDILICPACRAALTCNAVEAVCSSCGCHYPRTSNGRLDLRLRKATPVSVDITLETDLFPPEDLSIRPLRANPAPQVDFSGVRAPRHLTPAMLSYFPRAASPASRVLDLGCGDASHRAVCEHAGFSYLGLDYGAVQADVLGDAQRLPFRDASFEFVLSVAVFEHIPHPLLMAQEAFRVIQPGGLFIGTVAFLEPFHSNSFYHHSHLGIYHTLHAAGFTVQALAPDPAWTGLHAQARNALFPRMPRKLIRALVAPLDLLSRAWWALARLSGKTADPLQRLRHTAGAFTFIASR